jgi:hypothetical protein
VIRWRPKLDFLAFDVVLGESHAVRATATTEAGHTVEARAILHPSTATFEIAEAKATNVDMPADAAVCCAVDLVRRVTGYGLAGAFP